MTAALTAPVTPDEHAREALRLVQVAPVRSLALAREAATAAHAHGDAAAASVADRAQGLAWTYVGDLDEALVHLRSAVEQGRRAGSAVLVAEARMSLAFALGRRGQHRGALREIETALADLDGVAHARGLVQRAAIHQQLGRFAEALAGYRRALPALRRAADGEWAQRALANRAVLHAFRHAYAAAEADLREAAALCEALGLRLSAAIVAENLGFVHARRGQVPAALRQLDLAERHYRALGANTGSLLVDRAELLLSVGLAGEARADAEQAVTELVRDHRDVALPEARLLLARAATLDGDPAHAVEQGTLAADDFDRQGRTAWGALARVRLLAARLCLGGPAGVPSSAAATAADALDDAGWAPDAVEARVLAGRLALAEGDLGAAHAHLGAAGRRRSAGPVGMRALAWYGEALLRLSTGNRHGAVSAVAAGVRLLDEHQTSLGATDLRASAAGRRTDLTGIALRVELGAGRADRVLHWAERGRARRLHHPLDPPHDPLLAHHLDELRAVVSGVEEARREGRGAAHLAARQAALERAVRDHCRRRDGTGRHPSGPPSADALAGALGDAALVEYVELDGTLYAVVVVGGDPWVRRVGPASVTGACADRLSLALHRLVAARPGPAALTGVDRLRRAAADADAALLRPLADLTGDRPLVVVPTGALQAVPWAALPSCAGRAVTLAPSATVWHSAQRPTPAPGEVLAAAGPGLPGARADTDAVCRAYRRTRVLAGGEATVAAVLAALTGASVAHLAAHGRIRGDNPLFSSLRFADGPLTVYDLERLGSAPHTVVLAACDAGRSVVRAGDEPLGLTAAFLALGTRQLVAPVAPVPDGPTADMTAGFHTRLARGLTAARALAEAQQAVAGEPEATAAAVAFVCTGAGVALPGHPDVPAVRDRRPGRT